MTTFGQMYNTGWAGGVETAGIYYRSVCQLAAVASLVKTVEPANPNVDWDRAKAIFMHVMNDYTTRAAGGGVGWGYPGGTGAPGSLPFQGSAIGASCGLAGGFVWPYLSTLERQTARAVFASLADRYYTYRTANWFTSAQASVSIEIDTLTETASADASFLALISQFYRGHPNNRLWLARAQELMNWAYSGYQYEAATNRYRVANHSMRFHPLYGISTPNDSGVALVAWAAQGVGLGNSSGINGITPLNPGSANSALYGYTANSAGLYRIFNVMASQTEWIKGTPISTGQVNSVPTIPSNSDFTFQSFTRNGANFSQVVNFQDKNYLGIAGVSDWGVGADFQNSAFAASWWLAKYVAPSSVGSSSVNYNTLLSRQAVDAGYGYLPTIMSSPTSGTWGYLASTCQSANGADVTRILVQFFESFTAPTTCSQTNTHLFLNTWSGYNHVVAYLLARGGLGQPFWPASGGNSTLPNFAN